MTRDESFAAPPTTTELCAAAKQFIVSNHAVSLAELESRHMHEINQCQVCTRFLENLVGICSQLYTSCLGRSVSNTVSLKVDCEETMRKLEMDLAFRARDEVSKYEQLLMDKDDSYQDRMRNMDDKVFFRTSKHLPN